jgi:predicted transcriptional regulator
MEKRKLTFNIDSQIVKKLKFLAVETDRSITDLLTEAINDIILKFHKPVLQKEEAAESVAKKAELTSEGRVKRKVIIE